MGRFLGWLHDPLVAGLLALVVLACLAWRWARLDRGALAGVVELKDVLRAVHAASRRQVFTESAVGAALALVIVGLLASAYPGLPDGAARAVRSWASSPTAAADGFSSTAAMLGVVLAATLLLAFTLLVPLHRERHHWLATLRWLHRPRKQNQQPCERRTCEALAYCTNLGVFKHAVRARPGPVTLADEWYDFLLSANRHHLQLLSERDAQARRSRLLQRMTAHADQSGEPVLVAGRVRAAFGGGWVAFLAAALAFAAAAAFAAAVAGLIAVPT
jgi:hypothetical protein